MSLARGPEKHTSKGNRETPMRIVRPDILQKLVTRACKRMGASPEDAAQVATSLVAATLCGYDSHGVYRLVQYHDWWKRGLLDPAARPILVREAPFAAQVDGRRGFGPVVARFATRIAIGKARENGVAVVTVTGCTQVGRLADYAETIQDAGLIGLVTVNDYGVSQRLLHRLPGPGALVHELTEGLDVGAGQAGGHGLDGLPLPVEEEPPDVHPGPVLAFGAANADHQLVEELAEALLGGVELFGIHAGSVRHPGCRVNYYLT